MDVGLIPIRQLDDAKSRLGGSFDRAQRSALVNALVDDVLTLTTTCPALRWAVVTNDDPVAHRAEGLGLEVFRDTGTGLNEAIRGVVENLDHDGGLLILPMDLPLATCDDVRAISEVAETSDVVIVPSIGDGGTNALYLRPPDAMTTAFGPSSLERHVEAAAGEGLRATVLPIDNLGHDLDTADDVNTLLEIGRTSESRTVALLRELTQTPG